ncbi:MAG: squalene synthase HpnC [Bacteroidota bacterium]|nr:squalene synthase HpnC [Bacteroidota bacterium]MDP4237686.1 squalene synthase HpnC [Bacteroidota bacterium]
MTSQEAALSSAYDHCRAISLGHYENFPVGSVLIPKAVRHHFYALYAYMRSADDLADLPSRPPQERLDLLADWRRQLDDGIKGKEPENPIFLALCNTIRECDLPSEPLYRLLEAFEFDAKGNVQFETFEDLRWYTSRSADPVGQLVLALFGYRDAERIRLSNEICTALQLLNFIQDIQEDLGNKRFYYPQEDCSIFGFEIGTGDPDTDRLALVSLFELERVESLLDRGARLSESVSGRLRYELRAITCAARKLAKKIRHVDGQIYQIRPKLSKWEHFTVLVRSIFP